MTEHKTNLGKTERNILRAIGRIQEALQREFVTSDQITEELELDHRKVQDHLNGMKKQGYVLLTHVFTGSIVNLTPRGRIRLQELNENDKDGAAYENLP